MVCALLGLCNGLEDTVHHPEPVEDTVHHPESDNSTPVVSITNSYCPFKVSDHSAVLIDTCASHPVSARAVSWLLTMVLK